MEGFRKRAATLLSGGRSENPSEDRKSSRQPSPEKTVQEKGSGSIIPTVDQTDGTSQSIVFPEVRELDSGFSHAPVRARPPWIYDAYEDDEDEDEPIPSSQLLPQEPDLAHAAQHNHTPAITHPTAFLTRHKDEPGRRYDAKRRSDAPTSRHHPREIASRWKQFAEATEYPRNEEEHRQLVDEEQLAAYGPDFSSGWHEGQHNSNLNAYRPKKRGALARAQRTILHSPFIPLISRTIVFCFCVMALGLGATIFSDTRKLATPQPDQQCYMDYESSITSPLMAVVIDATAILYLVYITLDEYMGLPLGLRSVKAKTSVILFDLFFIVFSSANVTLAFESIKGFDTSCQEREGLQQVKWKQEYLASTLLIALIAWLMTFAVSILRVVEKFEH